MIIICENCNKKFNIDSNLIPSKGRLLQCSSCDHKWFFKKEVEENIDEKIKIDKKEEIPISIDNEQQNSEVFEDSINNDIKINNEDKKTNILSLIIVILISFTAIIILLDTFKGPISKIFPNIELILYNLYETVKDIKLFFLDLI
ncbi:zinc-ribbon domain-containing protein [Candidatus Pelagibacter sp.]|nr:zinc-ribbon domain-containing protein [Candidatus Pelagibacter sp.]